MFACVLVCACVLSLLVLLVRSKHFPQYLGVMYDDLVRRQWSDKSYKGASDFCVASAVKTIDWDIVSDAKVRALVRVFGRAFFCTPCMFSQAKIEAASAERAAAKSKGSGKNKTDKARCHSVLASHLPCIILHCPFFRHAPPAAATTTRETLPRALARCAVVCVSRPIACLFVLVPLMSCRTSPRDMTTPRSVFLVIAFCTVSRVPHMFFFRAAVTATPLRATMARAHTRSSVVAILHHVVTCRSVRSLQDQSKRPASTTDWWHESSLPEPPPAKRGAR